MKKGNYCISVEGFPLKPCPNIWCEEDEDFIFAGYNNFDVFVCCGGCGLTGPSGKDKKQAADLWNEKRPKMVSQARYITVWVLFAIVFIWFLIATIG